jgi:hypothetical protein
MQRIVLSFDEEARGDLERLKMAGGFRSFGETVRQILSIVSSIHMLAQQGYSELILANPKTGKQKTVAIPMLAKLMHH